MLYILPSAQAQDRGEETVSFDFGCGNIISTTKVDLPINKDRKELGVGEEVGLKLVPSKGIIKWEIISGTASFDKMSIVKTITAEEPSLFIGEKTDDVVVRIEDCSSTKIRFKIYKPTDVKFICGSRGLHKIGYPSAGITAQIFVFPSNVSFYNLELQEQDKVVTVNSPYWGPLFHDQGNWIPCSEYLETGLGTALQFVEDNISICGGEPFVVNANQTGSTSCDIPVKFRIKNTNVIIPNTNVTNLQESMLWNDGACAVRKEDVESITYPLGGAKVKDCMCTDNSCFFDCLNCCHLTN